MITMKNLLIILTSISLLVTSCATVKEHDKTAIGAAAGAVIGAGVGYAVGGGKGAAIGAGAGALAGGGIGYVMDRQEKEFRKALAESEAASIRREQRVLEEAKAESAKREQEVLVLSFKSDFWFNFDSAVLKRGGHREIDKVAEILNRYPQTTIRVVGLTDSVGNETYNLQLSEKRAMTVKNALVARGVDSSRIETIGFGETKPIADNNDEGGRQLNRRVEIVIIPNE